MSDNNHAGGDEKSRKQRMKEMREAKVAAIRQEQIDAIRKREEKLRPEAAGEVPQSADEAFAAMTPEQQRDAIAERLKQLETKAALENAVPGRSAEQLLNEAAVAEFDDFERTFTEARWGIRARMTGGPIIVTTVTPDSEGARNHVQVGDVICVVNGVDAEVDRETVIAALRAGGAATLSFKRLRGGHAPVMPGIQGGATGTLKGEKMEAGEMARLQAMLGHAKGKDTVTYAGVNGVTESIGEDSVAPTATLVFGNCHNTTYTLNAMVTKIFVQGCTDFKLVVRSKVLTATVELYKCERASLEFAVKCGTLQIDMCRDVNVTFAEQAHFFEEADPEHVEKKNTNMIVWAGCHNLNVAVTETGHTFKTTFDDLKHEFKDLVEERSQFRLKLARHMSGELRFVQERITRLDNGFFSTMAETVSFDTRQESNLKAMAKSMGITLNPAKPKGTKCKPNDLCPHGSGKKFKKCCNAPDGICQGKPADCDW